MFISNAFCYFGTVQVLVGIFCKSLKENYKNEIENIFVDIKEGVAYFRDKII